jgi:rRNA biogenesis protein RRP5
VDSIDVANNKVELSLRKNAAIKESSLDYSDLRKGQMIRGVVKRVEAYGAFIRIDGSNISGLCHKSKVRLPLSSFED